MLQLVQKSLHNPMVVKTLFASMVAVLMFLLCVSMMRSMRRRLQEESRLLSGGRENANALAFGAYQGVIAQLRDQEKRMQKQREQELQQTAMAEAIQETMLANLNTGVLFFDRQGVVRQANRAARVLLGYQSPFSLHLRDIFRGITRVHWRPDTDEASSPAPLVQSMQQLLRDATPFPRIKADYLTPAGQRRVLAITAAAVLRKDGTVLGASCLVEDHTELAELSQEMERNESLASLGEISAGVVNDFRNSLATISGYAQVLTQPSLDNAEQRHYAEKIIAEAESLARIVGQFLEFAGSSKN